MAVVVLVLVVVAVLLGVFRFPVSDGTTSLSVDLDT